VYASGLTSKDTAPTVGDVASIRHQSPSSQRFRLQVTVRNDEFGPGAPSGYQRRRCPRRPVPSIELDEPRPEVRE
jgi:hypothetical protein